MSTEMTRIERGEFLAGTHIGVLSVAEPDGSGPLALPIWYSYVPGGEIRFSTHSGSRKLALVQAADRAGFLAQSESLPYRYVSVEGSVAGIEPTDPEEYREWSLRYLGPERGERFFAFVRAGLGAWRTVRLHPKRWRTFDFAKEFPGP